MAAPATIDLNADLGEEAGHDEELLAIVTSANVACGAHAGGPIVAAATCAAAVRRGVVIGAHPGHEDRESFGRRALEVAPAELERTLLAQVEMLRAAGTPRYLKLHGALYHQVAADAHLAAATVAVAAQSRLAILGPPGSILLEHARAAGLEVAAEGFVDRGYRLVGGRPELVPRGERGALLDAEDAIRQAVRLATEGVVAGPGGEAVPVVVDSLCVHGDTPDAVRIAARVRDALERAGVELRAFAG
jgi:UPF0271 protein